MDPYTNPELAASSRRRGSRGPLVMAVLIVAMVALSIAGSAYWRPAPGSRNTLELGGATPVGFDARDPTETISRVLEMVAPTVVFLTMPDAGRSGSGVVVHSAGFVVTNAHVVEDVERLRVAFKDGAEYDAVVYGVDTATDLAVVKVESDRPLPVAVLGDSDALKVGEFVLALGAPFGLEATATSGIVSGLHRSGLGIARYEDFIVTDAPINRGNSGGPLVNLRGEVVGINTAIIAGEEQGRGRGGFSGVGFAIPVNVMRVVAQRVIGDGGLVPAGEQTPGSPGSSGGTATRGPLPRSRTVALQAEPGAPPRSFDRGGTVPEQVPSPIPAAAVAIVQGFDARGVSLGVGTGFFVTSEIGPVLVTNQHVISNARAVYVYRREGTRWATLWGSVVSENALLDLALVQISDERPVTMFELGSAEGLGIGAAVGAVGARFESESVVAALNTGVVTALGVRVAGIAREVALVQTDAVIEPGDSGGPLLNAAGEVVGVMVARENGAHAAAGDHRSLAIPMVHGVQVKALIVAAESGTFDTGFSRAYSPGYILVINLDPGGEGARQGLRDYDHIVAIDGQQIPVPDVGEMVARRLYLRFLRQSPGTTVNLLISRANERGAGRTELLVPFVVPGSRAP